MTDRLPPGLGPLEPRCSVCRDEPLSPTDGPDGEQWERVSGACTPPPDYPQLGFEVEAIFEQLLADYWRALRPFDPEEVVNAERQRDSYRHRFETARCREGQTYEGNK